MPTFLSLLFCLCSLSLLGQNLRAYQKALDAALEQKDYPNALHYTSEALRLASDDMDLQYQYAGLAARAYAFEESKAAYLKVYESQALSRYPETAYHLGEVCQQLGQYDEAVAYFQAYQKKGGQQPVADRVAACQWAKKDSQEMQPWDIQRLGRKVNTPYSEFAPVLRGDTLYYSSMRYDWEEDEHQPIRKLSRALYQRGQGRGRPISRFNSDDAHTAHVAPNTAHDRLYFTVCQYINASEIRCQLYYRDKDKRKRWERQAHALPNNINLPEYTTTQPTVGYDSTLRAEVLFFVSDRPAGGGGLDLWQATLHGDSVGTPVALEGLNTPSDELTPYFHTPSQTLYFSSNGYRNYGGYDIYQTRRTADGWTSPDHLGAPANTSYHDVYYSLSDDGQRAFLASNRPGAKLLGESPATCCHDIYQLDYQPPTPPLADTPQASTPIPIGANPTPTPNTPPAQLEDYLPLALYFDNDQPGRRTRKLTTNLTYGETYQSYIQKVSEYESAFTEELEGEQELIALDAINTFFEEDVQKGYRWLNRFSELLLERLESGRPVEIFVKGYTSPRAQRAYNLALSQRRISSVRNHFRSYQDGVLVPYLESGQLQVSERPFGEAAASQQVSDELADLRNSIYHPDAARERRVEIVELR